MLAEPTLVLIDRLVATLMALVEAATTAIKTPTQTLGFDAATALLDRAANLVLRLITISNFGLRTRKPKTDTPKDPTPDDTPDPTPTDRPRTPQFPRRRGWLLEALPDLAPTIAADLQAILADPATQSLLQSAPNPKPSLPSPPARPSPRPPPTRHPRQNPTPAAGKKPTAPPQSPSPASPPNPHPKTPSPGKAKTTPNLFHYRNKNDKQKPVPPVGEGVTGETGLKQAGA